MEILTSYISCRQINGICIPLPIQTTYLRSYAVSKNKILSMPNVEWTNSSGYSKLFSLIIDKDIKEIAICSVFMVDFMMLEKEVDILKENTIFHFPLENKVLNLKASIKYYKTYIQLRELSKSICNFT